MRIENVLGEPGVNLTPKISELAGANTQLLLKRLFDLSGSLILIVVLAPLFLLIAALIKLSSRGPVFYVQERLGQHQIPFRMYKFRTMVDGAERDQQRLWQSCSEGPFFKLKSDPRVLPLGNLLRRSSLDELPQLFNVLFGQMSLIGPRPVVQDEAIRLSQWNYLRRFSMKPGISGLWQVSGRSDTSAETRLDLDLHYVRRWSLWLDLQLAIKTIPTVLKGKGAV